MVILLIYYWFRKENMEHYITEIRISRLRHLKDIIIPLNPENRQNLIITGKNGSGKTSLLLALRKYLKSINDGQLMTLVNYYIPQLSEAEKKLGISQLSEIDKSDAVIDYKDKLKRVRKYKEGVDVLFNNNYEDIEMLYMQGGFITAYFPANRKTTITREHGVKEVKLGYHYFIDESPGDLLHKYLVHLKTQQSYARNEGDIDTADKIQKWFDRFTEALCILLDDNTVTLKYDYKEYDFQIHLQGREPFGFDTLSDGYSSVILIVSDLMLRMEQDWLLGNNISTYDKEGIVLIDEIETHLHISLQKKILPFLIKFFPRIQFIVTTHSPYILNSVSNAKAYDLEKHMELENLAVYSSDGLADGYFETDEYSYELKEKLKRYKYLKGKDRLSDKERAERAILRSELKNIPQGLSKEAKDEFEEIEGRGL